MFRLVPGLTISAIALMLAVPALAADYPMDFRAGYPSGYEQEDPLGFEIGLRYWYSKGEQNNSALGQEFKSNDTTHILEGHLRIEDASTQSYVKGQAGYSVGMESSADDIMGNLVTAGHIGHAGADFGWMPLGDQNGTASFGALIGYQYWNDAPSSRRTSFVTGVADGAVTGRDSAPTNIDIHALRLGVTAKADFGQFDITAEVAGVPYAWVNGTLGGAGLHSLPPGYHPASAVALDGQGYGAMAEVMLGFKPTENMAVRLGGRAWYIAGDIDSRFDIVNADTEQTQGFISNGWNSFFRYGALAELTYKF